MRRLDKPVNSSVLARILSVPAVFASESAKLIRIKASAIVIKPGSKIKLGKNPGFKAAIPNKVVLAINAIVALYEDILSENLLSCESKESETEIRYKPRIQPSSVIAPNSYVELRDDQIKNKSPSANESSPPASSNDLRLSGVSRT